VALTYGYVRVSTDEQFATRLSIEEQQRQIRQFCRAHGLDLGPNDERLQEESASAYHLDFIDRPLGKALNERMGKGDHLVIAKLDRAFRNLLDAVKCVSAWQDRGVIVHMLDLPISGQPIFDKLILSMLAWCAEFESFRKSERMIDCNRAARRLGRPIAQCAPLGFRWLGHRSKGTHRLAYFPEERAHCRLCYELYIEEDLSLWEIASALMCRKSKPFDKRAPEAQARSKLRVAQEYTPAKITEMIHLEAELRFYEAQGHTPEAAAALWLKYWGEGTLPNRDELQASVNSRCEINSLKEGEPACEPKNTI
jgi:DNA invertase Pin-like site-specific DNA recombinase